MKTWRKLAAAGLTVLFSVASAPAAAVPDRLTPSDAEMVVQINVRQLLQTPLVKKHALDSLKALLEHSTETHQLLRAAGLNLFQDIDTMALSLSGHPLSNGKLLVVVRGCFAPDKVRTAADDYAQKHPNRLKRFQDDGLLMWEIHNENKTLYAAFADSKTLVMTAAQKDTVAAVRRAGQPPQRPSAAMQAALAHLKGSENVWLALAATDELKQLLKGDDMSKDFAAALQAVTGALELNDDAQVRLMVHTNSAEAATQIKSKLEELMPLLAFLGAGKDTNSQIVKELIDSIQLKTEKNAVCLRLHITDAQIDKARKKDR
jgi:hypothetical protein